MITVGTWVTVEVVDVDNEGDPWFGNPGERRYLPHKIVTIIPPPDPHQGLKDAVVEAVTSSAYVHPSAHVQGKINALRAAQRPPSVYVGLRDAWRQALEYGLIAGREAFEAELAKLEADEKR